MCNFYCVSRSGFYDWKKRGSLLLSDSELVSLIEECQTIHRRRYGYRRVALWLKAQKDVTVNKKRVLRVMAQYSLLSVIRRRKLGRYSTKGSLIYANALNRNFHADRPNEKWVTDISYVVTPAGTLYLSAIRDLFDNFIVAHKMAGRQDYTLVDRTIQAALSTETPNGKVILHSDQGGQYRSFGYRNRTNEANLTPSMSSPGTPGDNALAENFFSIFKTECIYLEKPQTPDDAIRLTEEFIEYYNYSRIQLRTGLTPYEQRRVWMDKDLGE